MTGIERSVIQERKDTNLAAAFGVARGAFREMTLTAFVGINAEECQSNSNLHRAVVLLVGAFCMA